MLIIRNRIIKREMISKTKKFIFRLVSGNGTENRMEWKLEGMENKEQNITYYISFIHIYDFFLYKKTNSLFQIMLLIIYIY